MKLLLLLLSVVYAKKCASTYGNKKLKNIEADVSFCWKHAGKTCCDKNDVKEIWNKFEEARMTSVNYDDDVGLSAEC